MLVVAEREQLRPQRRFGRKVEAAPRRAGERFGKARLGDGYRRQPRTRRSGVQDHLTGNAERVGKERAQALVPRHQIAERGFQRRNVERAGEPHRHRDRVGGAAPFQAIEEPQPPLRKRQRDLGRARNGKQGRPCRLRLVETFGQALHGWDFEQAADRDLDVQGGADAADQPRRQQRMPAELEEVVVDADPLEPQHLGEQGAQDLLLRSARRAHFRQPSAPAPAAHRDRACRWR